MMATPTWMSSPSVMSSTFITLADCNAVRRGHPRHQQCHCTIWARLFLGTQPTALPSEIWRAIPPPGHIDLKHIAVFLRVRSARIKAGLPGAAMQSGRSRHRRHIHRRLRDDRKGMRQRMHTLPNQALERDHRALRHQQVNIYHPRFQHPPDQPPPPAPIARAARGSGSDRRQKPGPGSAPHSRGRGQQKATTLQLKHEFLPEIFPKGARNASTCI